MKLHRLYYWVVFLCREAHDTREKGSEIKEKIILMQIQI